MHTGFLWEYLGLDRRVILKWIVKKWDGGKGVIDLIAVAQDGDRRWVL